MVMGSFILASSIGENCTCDRIALAEKCHKSCRSEKSFCYSCKKLIPSMDGNKNLDNTCHSSSIASQSQLSSLSTIANCSQFSSVPSMEDQPRPTLVYYRRKTQTKSVSSAQSSARLSDSSLSYISSEAPSKAAVEVQKKAFNISSESSNGRFGDEKGLCCVNDSYSSSKLNEELSLVPFRAEADENGECSSSDNLSERDICISIIRNQWTIDGIWPFKVPSSNETPGATSNSSCMKICKVCEIQERSVEMLICDQCDEAFHVSCCNVKKIPIGEWFCCFCLKKKHKILMRNSQCEVSTFEENVGPIASTLIGIGTYICGARIGKQFQADVPDWSGPCFDEVDVIDESVEIDPLVWACLHGQNHGKLPRISSIGNWVQCRQVIEGMGDDADGTICGKWRRAPLFEVQTDNWECFRSVLWDPAHADCSVPQELDTDQVLKQLKYIEMLRPQLRAKRCKPDQVKEQNLEDVKRTQQNP